MFDEETSKIFQLMYSANILEYTYPFVYEVIIVTSTTSMVHKCS